MVRKASQQAVTAKMYKHFAVVTVLITGAMAFMTDDRAAAELQSAVREEPRGADAKAYGEAKLVRRSGGANELPPIATGWGADNYELGMDGVGGTAVGSYIPTDMQVAAPSEDVLERLGITAEQFARLSPEDQRRLLRQAAGGSGGVSAAQRRAQIERATEASRARSGETEYCDDC